MSFRHHKPLFSAVTLTLLGLGLLWFVPLRGQKAETDEQKHAEQSRKIFETVHCPKSDPIAVVAFSGCWKIGSIVASPVENNLSLGMRMSEKKAQLLIDSYGATQGADSENPRYCTGLGRPSVAPHPNADFCCKDLKDISCECVHGASYEYTYVYVILDIPPQQASQMAAGYYRFVEEEVSVEEYQEAVTKFANQGGKYIRTLINMGPTHVWWDSDAEEDFWALPTSCEGWERVQKQLKDPSVPKSPERWSP